MTQQLPRLVAAVAFLIGLVGLGVSLPLLYSVKTSLFLLLGVSAWAFFLWRALSKDFNEVFFTGWIWSAILHLGLLPLSLFIPAILGTELPVPILILVMFVLSMIGLLSEFRLSTQARDHLPTEERDRIDTEQDVDPNA